MRDNGDRSDMRTMLLSVSWSGAGSPLVEVLCMAGADGAMGGADGAGLSKWIMSLRDKPWTKAG